MNRVLFVFGTRPEAIKLAPLIAELRGRSAEFATGVCLTGQHREMLQQVLDFFEVTPDYHLELMLENQSLFEITSNCICKLEPVIQDYGPDVLIVQGDTTSAFAGALAAYYLRSRVAHVEAGLRTWNKYAPYPEEMNRAMIGQLADYHFAPTRQAARNLRRNGVQGEVHVVGNTVIDALYLCLAKLDDAAEARMAQKFGFVDRSRKLILVTAHRRESFGAGLRGIFAGLRGIVDHHPEVEVVYPVHLNPNVRAAADELLAGVNRIHLLAPVNYDELVWLMKQCYFVITDSGGIQEEAPALDKPVLVVRVETERVEGLAAGTLELVGTDANRIAAAADQLLGSSDKYTRMATARNPYGDGRASSRIADVIVGCRAGAARL
jgi:UDP-N-acetylglucosamine 2-epimerase (non-hydrolysing)